MDLKLGRLFWEITGDSSKLVKDLLEADAKVQKTGSAWQKVGGKLSLAVTAPLLGIGAAALKSAADLDQNRIAFETMLGSADRAQTLLKDIEKFAAATPFEMPGLVNGAKRLIAFGVSAEDVVGKLTNLGNAAGGNQEQLDRLILAYGKLQAKGRASLEELNMFTEAGVPIMKELQKQYGVTEAEMFKMVSTGKVGFADVDAALTSLTTGSGQFAGMIEKQSKSFSGVLSTFKDTLNMTGRAMVTGLLPPLTDALVAATKAVEKFAALDDGTKKLILTVAGVAMAAGPLIAAIGTAIKVFGTLKTVILAVNAVMLANPWVAAAAAIVAVGVTIGKVVGDIKKQSDELKAARTFDVSGTLEENTAKLAAFRVEVQGAFDRAKMATGEQRRILQAAAEDLAAQYRQMAAQVEIQEIQAEKMEGIKAKAAALRAEEEKRTLEMQRQLQLQEDIAARVEKRYTDARALVLDVLENEKTEYQKIQDQIDQLEATPWAKGALEEDRLQALEALRAKQAELVAAEVKEREEAEAAKLEAERKAEEERLNIINAFYLSEEELKIQAIYTQAEAYRQAGVDTVAVEQWTQEQIDALREAEAEKERERNLIMLQDKVKLFSSTLNLASNLNTALDQFAQNELTRMEQNGASEEELDKRKKELAQESFKRKKALAIAQATIDTAAAIVGFLKDPGGFAGAALSVAAGVTGAIQIAAIAAEPLPALAHGGIALPTPGGRTVQVAEAGSAEAVIPLNEEGKKFMQEATGTAASSGSMVSVPVQFTIPGFKDMLYSTINVGLRNGEIQVDARKLTNLPAAIRGER